jgi:hypothetical protein
MRIEEITVESIAVEAPFVHHDLSPYETVVFRVLPADHPNSFTVPVSVNLDQFSAHDAQSHARFVFHRLMRALADATAPWDRADAAEAGSDESPPDLPASATDARLGPAADSAEGKR